MADRKKMEGHCSTGQSPHWAVVPMEEEEEEKEEKEEISSRELRLANILSNGLQNRLRSKVLKFSALLASRLYNSTSYECLGV